MKKNPESSDSTVNFSDAMSGIKPISQDTVVFNRQERLKSNATQKRIATEEKKVSASFQFSDGFEAYSDTQQVISYIQGDEDKNELKKLRRGQYAPDLILDLHGLNKAQSKQELAALVHEAVKQRHYCISIMHGKGNHILKRAVPNWLMQHPSILAFHQAPKQWGGESAILVLLQLPHDPFNWQQQ